jgi:hypothetical protein
MELNDCRKQAFTQLCAFCSPLCCAQNSCYGLIVAALSDSVVCKVKSWLLHVSIEAVST